MKCLSDYSQLCNFAIFAIINSMLTSWDPMDDDEMLMPRCKGDICSSEQLEHTMCTYASPLSSIIIISIVRSDKSSVCCPIPAFSAKKLLRREWIWNLAQALHGENFTRQFLYAKFQILSLCTPQKHVCFAINTIKDNFFLQILLPRGVWIETNSNLLRTSKSWPSKFMKSNQHFILQTWKLCELHELCQLPWVA